MVIRPQTPAPSPTPHIRRWGRAAPLPPPVLQPDQLPPSSSVGLAKLLRLALGVGVLLMHPQGEPLGIDLTGFPVSECFQRLRHDFPAAPIVAGAPLHTEGLCDSPPESDARWWFVGNPEQAHTMLTDQVHPSLAVAGSEFVAWVFAPALCRAAKRCDMRNIGGDVGPVPLPPCPFGGGGGGGCEVHGRGKLRNV